MRYGLACLLMIAVGLLAAPAPARADDTARPAKLASGATVGAVDWGDLHGLNRDELERVSGLTVGRVVSPAMIRTAIKALAALPDVRQVTVQAVPEASGQVALKIITVPVRRLERIDVIGAKKFDANEIIRATRLAVGDEIDREVLEKAILRIREIYSEKGYFNVQVSDAVALAGPSVGPERTVVQFSITEGKRARIGSIRFPGLKDIGHNGLPKGVRWKSRVGARFDAGRLRADVARLESDLEKRGYLNPHVGPYQLSYDEGGVSLVVPVRVRERVRLMVSGNRHIKTSRVLELLDLSRQSGMDEQTLADARQRVEDDLFENGFREAEVKLVARRSPVEVLYDVRVEIHSGPRYRAVSVALEGNRALSDNQLEPLVAPGWCIPAEPVR